MANPKADYIAERDAAESLAIAINSAEEFRVAYDSIPDYTLCHTLHRGYSWFHVHTWNRH